MVGSTPRRTCPDLLDWVRLRSHTRDFYSQSVGVRVYPGVYVSFKIFLGAPSHSDSLLMFLLLPRFQYPLPSSSSRSFLVSKSWAHYSIWASGWCNPSHGPSRRPPEESHRVKEVPKDFTTPPTSTVAGGSPVVEDKTGTDVGN